MRAMPSAMTNARIDQRRVIIAARNRKNGIRVVIANNGPP